MITGTVRAAIALSAALLAGCGKPEPSFDPTPLTKRLDAVERRQAFLQDWRDASTRAQETSARDREALTKRANDQASQIAELQEALKTSTDRAADARDAQRTLVTRAEALEKDVAKLRETVVTLRVAMAAPNQDLADAQKRLDRQQEAIDLLRHLLATAQEREKEDRDRLDALGKQAADAARAPTPPPPAQAADIEVHHAERVELVDNQVVLTVEGSVTNTAKAAADVDVTIAVAAFRGRDRQGRTAYKLDGPSESQEFRALRPGETRPLLVRIVLATTARIANLHDYVWSADVDVSKAVR